MPLSPPLVAVVDDEESIRKALKRLLRSAGLDVETYASGQEFLDSLHTRPPSCVVLDLHMPQLSGLDVQAKVKETSARLPLIFITAHDDPSAREQALRGGAVSYLRKPIDDQTLLDAIADALGEKRSQSNNQ